MTYQPVFRVVTDGNGKFLRIDACNCDEGGYPWEPDYETCPVHRHEQTQDALTQADIAVNG